MEQIQNIWISAIDDKKDCPIKHPFLLFVCILMALSLTQTSLAAEQTEHQNFHEVSDTQMDQRFAHRLDSALNVTGRFIHLRFVRTSKDTFQLLASIYTKTNDLVGGNLFYVKSSNRYLMFGDIPDGLVRKIDKPRILPFNYTEEEKIEQRKIAWLRLFNYNVVTGGIEELEYAEQLKGDGVHIEETDSCSYHYNVREIALDTEFLNTLDSILKVKKRYIYLTFKRQGLNSFLLRTDTHYEPYPNTCFYHLEHKTNHILFFGDVPDCLISQLGDEKTIPFCFSQSKFDNTLDPYHVRMFNYDATSGMFEEFDSSDYLYEQTKKYDQYIK